MKFLNLFILLSLFYNFGSSKSSSCGELHNITYPYQLHGTCGGETYKLLCDGNHTVLYVETTKYLVKDISIENKTLRLVDSDLALGRCQLPKQTFFWHKNFVLGNFILTIFIHFFNCTEEVRHSDYKPIHCMDDPRSRVYAGLPNTNNVGSIPESCRHVGSTLAGSEMEMVWDDIDGDDVMQMLRRGFVVSWDIGIVPFSNSVDGNEMCSLMQYCVLPTMWYAKDVMGDNNYNTGEKLIKFFGLQYELLSCTYYELAPTHVLFGFMFILLAIMDILLLLLAIRLTLVPLAIFSFLLHKYKRVSPSINSVEKFLRKHEMLSVRRYDFIEIVIMTNHFREKLGQGGFGSVYKGKLFSGCQVAVKILTNLSGDGDDFISEVATIGRIHHTNIVQLIGFCSEGSKRALVYPYMQKGSLDKHIFSSINNSISVEKRREIALGIAHGIDYLHRGCQMQILHFDIKPHNILLDHDLTTKISDFGLAKLYSREYNLVALSTARGTVGYIAPELISRAFGVISYKADVYSFGMLLMEMTSGRRNVDNHAQNSSQVYYPSWIYDQIKLTDETCNYNFHNCVPQFGETEGILYKVALWCIQMRASNRPSMSRVIEMLQSDADSLEMPPKPFTSSSPDEVSTRCFQVDSCSIGLSAISEEIGLH